MNWYFIDIKLGRHQTPLPAVLYFIRGQNLPEIDWNSTCAAFQEWKKSEYFWTDISSNFVSIYQKWLSNSQTLSYECKTNSKMLLFNVLKFSIFKLTYPMTFMQLIKKRLTSIKKINILLKDYIIER